MLAKDARHSLTVAIELLLMAGFTSSAGIIQGSTNNGKTNKYNFT